MPAEASPRRGQMADDRNDMRRNTKTTVTIIKNKTLRRRGGQLPSCLAESIVGRADINQISVARLPAESPD